MNTIGFLVVAATILTAWPLSAQTEAPAPTQAELLERAIFAEETTGDTDGAIRIYEQLLRTPGLSRDMTAQVQLRLADSRRRRSQELQAPAATFQARHAVEADSGPPGQSKAAAMVYHDHPSECCGTFSVNYDPDRLVTVTGTVKASQWVSPMVTVLVAGTDGNTWGFTLASPNRLLRAGLARDTFKPGQAVAVAAYLAKGQESGCPTAVPSACATLTGGALHASASLMVNGDGRVLFDRNAPPDDALVEQLRALNVKPTDAPLVVNGSPTKAGVAENRAFQRNYDPQKSVSVFGTVADVQWTEPRVIVFITAADGAFWGFVMNSPSDMVLMGWTPDSLKVGETVQISGALAKGTGTSCPAPLPNACAMLPNGARHARAHMVVRGIQQELPPIGAVFRDALGRGTGPAPGAPPTTGGR